MAEREGERALRLDPAVVAAKALLARSQTRG